MKNNRWQQAPRGSRPGPPCSIIYNVIKKNKNKKHSMSKIERAFYMSVLSFSGDEQRGSSRRPLKCKNKPKNIIRKSLFHIQLSQRQGYTVDSIFRPCVPWPIGCCLSLYIVC